VAELLALPLTEMRARVEAAATSSGSAARPDADVLLLPPVDGLTEVWASGVTYERSMDARVEESQGQDAYTRVYGAERPELFSKCPAWRVVTDGEPVGIRADSAISVPEPELALVVNGGGEVVGYAASNDMSSRDIEGENLLYLPQAKTYAGSFALGTGIRPAWEVPDPYALPIRVTVHRAGTVAWEAETSTARMHRSFDDLAAYLVLAADFPAGAVLATGTGVVPELEFALREGDRVEIAVDGVGTLVNPVACGREPFAWVTRALHDPFAREEARST
jgi:2-dehydro-3-deoxy-D-arabinonate dehydratase